MSINKKVTQTYNSANPNVATVTSTRTALATTLVCDNLAGWPADTVHFSTYQLNTSSEVVEGSQTDWKGIVSGNSIGSLTRVAGASDTGNAIGDVVEMGPTASWAQGMYDGIAAEHDPEDGTHTDITADSIVVADAGTLEVDTINEATTAAGVTVDGLLIKDSKLATNNSVVTANITDEAVTSEKLNATIAFRGTTTQSVSGGAAGETITTYTEVYDYGSDFNHTTGVFTAPVDGVYHFNACVAVQNQTSDSARMECGITTSGGSTKQYGFNTIDTHDPGMSCSIDVLLTAGQTATMYATLEGSDLSLESFTYFAGHLVGAV